MSTLLRTNAKLEKSADQSMAYRTKSVLLPDLNKYPVVSRQSFVDQAPEDYHRFLDTDTGISPTSIPGMPGGTFVTTGLEHDEKGAPSYTPENRNKMMAKRYRKLETLEKELDANGNGTVVSVNSYRYSGGSAIYGPKLNADTQAVYDAALDSNGNSIIGG